MCCGSHSNTCDPSFLNQFVITWTHSSDYENCIIQVLKDSMVYMDIDPFANIRAIIVLMQQVSPSTKKLIDEGLTMFVSELSNES